MLQDISIVVESTKMVKVQELQMVKIRESNHPSKSEVRRSISNQPTLETIKKGEKVSDYNVNGSLNDSNELQNMVKQAQIGHMSSLSRFNPI